MNTDFLQIGNGEAVSRDRIPHLAFDDFRRQALDIVANGGKKAIKELDGLRNDQIIALLGRVTQLVNADLAPERWLGAMHLVEVVSERKKNLALGVVRPLARMAAPGGSLSGKVQLPESFVETIYPYIQRTIDS